MLTSAQRAQLRAQANGLETILMVGKGGVTDAVIAQADQALEARELIKGKVLETAMLTPAEVSAILCEALGADGVQTVGTKFVLYRKSKESTGGTARAKPKYNPVRAGAKARRQAAKKQREARNEYFHQKAVDEAIEKRKQSDR